MGDRDQQPVPDATTWRHPNTPRIFRLVYGRVRHCYCAGCIVLTLDEQAYQRRVFRLARAWSKMLRREQKRQAA